MRCRKARENESAISQISNYPLPFHVPPSHHPVYRQRCPPKCITRWPGLIFVAYFIVNINVFFYSNGINYRLTSINVLFLSAYCALARPWEGLLIGAIGALITCLSVPLIEKIKVDDPVGVIPVHFVAAVWSMLSVGLFGETDELEDFLMRDGVKSIFFFFFNQK